MRRFVIASEQKAAVMEQQLYFNIFMQAPDSTESKEFFALQRKTILAKIPAEAHDANSNKDNDGDQNSNEVGATVSVVTSDTGDTTNKENNVNRSCERTSDFPAAAGTARTLLSSVETKTTSC